MSEEVEFTFLSVLPPHVQDDGDGTWGFGSDGSRSRPAVKYLSVVEERTMTLISEDETFSTIDLSSIHILSRSELDVGRDGI